MLYFTIVNRSCRRRLNIYWRWYKSPWTFDNAFSRPWKYLVMRKVMESPPLNIQPLMCRVLHTSRSVLCFCSSSADSHRLTEESTFIRDTESNPDPSSAWAAWESRRGDGRLLILHKLTGFLFLSFLISGHYCKPVHFLLTLTRSIH